MKIKVITSFDERYYNLIGKECVDTWLEYWPKELSLTCYVENFRLENTKRIEQIEFDQLPKEYFEFQESKFNDRVKIFSKKAYSVIHAFENLEADRIIWVDADVITFDKIPLAFLENLCPDDTLATFMGVQHHKIKGDETSPLMFSGETGFFILNKNHKGFTEFSNRYKEYYNKRITKNLRRFYDGEVFGAVVEEFKDKYKFFDLASTTGKKAKSPLKYTELGKKYIRHYKSKHSKLDFTEDNSTD
jgi:hypothetical protein